MRKIKVAGVSKKAAEKEKEQEHDVMLERDATVDLALRGALEYMRTMTDKYIELEKRVQELENK